MTEQRVTVAITDLETGFAAEQEEISALTGSPNQAESIAAGFEQRPPRFTDPG